jgi:CheY-like chemotaxis protein
MPEMGGKAFIRHMKGSPKLNSIPIIVISSITNEREEEELRSSGVVMVIRKPLSPMAVMDAVEAVNNQS